MLVKRGLAAGDASCLFLIYNFFVLNYIFCSIYFFSFVHLCSKIYFLVYFLNVSLPMWQLQVGIYVYVDFEFLHLAQIFLFSTSTILSLCLMFIKYIFLFYLILLYPCDSYRPVCRGRDQVGRAASRPRRSATGSVPTRPRLGAAARCLTDRRGSVAAAAATRVAAGWTAEAFLLSGNVKCISATYILAVNLLHYQFFCVEQHS